MAGLPSPTYMTFPFEVESNGPKVSTRILHIREQIEQVLFTNPGERVFRPEFGAGIRALVFEPNASALWDVTKKRLMASLTEALKGEVDPRTLNVEVPKPEPGEQEQLRVVISYTIATIGHTERHEFQVSSAGDGNG